MYTSQKEASCSPLVSSPAALPAGRRLCSAAKGKAVDFVDAPHPPLFMGRDRSNIDDWRGFRDAGLLDQATLQRKNREALLETVSRLERELHEYQHNMGLVLIEKEDLVSTCNELDQEVAEANEIVNREQSSHVIAMSEAEQRMKNTKRALEFEKKCLIKLQRSMRELRDEHECVKATSETRTTDVDTHKAQLEEELLAVKGKLNSANIQVDEADTKFNELDMKLQGLDAGEAALIVQHQTLNMEHDAHKKKVQEQREELKAWERKLRERAERLHEQRRILGDREDNLGESERRYKQKESSLDQIQKKIDLDDCTLKQREVDLRKQLEGLPFKEMEAEALKIDLKKREKQLCPWEERLTDRERVEIQNVIDEQRAVLDIQLEELELETQQKRSSLSEEFKNNLHAVEKKEVQTSHQEAKLVKREHVLGEKSKWFKEEEEKIEDRLTNLKHEESCLKNQENQLDAKRKEIVTERENLQILYSDIEKVRDQLKKNELLLYEENDKHIVNKEKRSEHIHLQSCLIQKLEKWRHEDELLMKEKEALSEDRRKIDKDWEALDEKRALVEKEVKKFEEQKETLERSILLEELKKKKIEMEGHIDQQMEFVRFEKESFAAKMKHEKLTLTENMQIEHEQLVQDSGQQRRDLENYVQKKQEETEKQLLEKRRAFEEICSRQMRELNHLKERVEKKREEVEACRLELQKAKDGIAANQKRLENEKHEHIKDSNELHVLRKKLKEQQEQLVNERARFRAFIEKLKSYKTCGDFSSEIVAFSDHNKERSSSTVNPEPLESSGQKKSWLQKHDSKMSNISLDKSMQHSTNDLLNLPPNADEPKMRIQGYSEASGKDSHSVNTAILEQESEESSRAGSSGVRRRSVKHRTASKLKEANGEGGAKNPGTSKRKRSEVESLKESEHSMDSSGGFGGENRRKETVLRASSGSVGRPYNLRQHKA